MLSTPPHIETRLKSSLADLQDLARRRGLADAFAMELHAVTEAVREALASGERDRASAAGREVAALKVRLQRAPAKRKDPGGARREDRSGPVMGRGGYRRD